VCLRASLHVFDRSREEWRRTIEWAKHTLLHSRSANPKPARRP
jgi:hypothetical protein